MNPITKKARKASRHYNAHRGQQQHFHTPDPMLANQFGLARFLPLLRMGRRHGRERKGADKVDTTLNKEGAT